MRKSCRKGSGAGPEAGSFGAASEVRSISSMMNFPPSIAAKMQSNSEPTGSETKEGENKVTQARIRRPKDEFEPAHLTQIVDTEFFTAQIPIVSIRNRTWMSSIQMLTKTMTIRAKF